MRIPATLLAISSLLLGACGSDPSADPTDAGPGVDAGADTDADPGADASLGPDAAPPAPGAFFVLFSNGVLPCEYPDDVTRVCPDDHNREIFRLDFDPETGAASEPIRLTDNSDGIAPAPGSSATTPDDDFLRAVSPDGQWMYFVNTIDGPAIYRTRTDGSLDTPERLTPADMNAGFVALSKDGTTLWTFMEQAGGQNFGLYRMDADGANAENLTADIAELGSLQALLPDESGFISKRGSGHDPEGIDDDGELYLFRLSDRQMVRLTDNRVNDTLAGIGPDGALYFTSFDDENSDGETDEDGGKNLWVVPLDTSVAPRRLTDRTGYGLDFMAATPDGERVIYEYRLETTGKKEIFALSLVDGSEVQLSDSPGGESSFFRLLSADGQTVIYTSNDNPGGFGDTELYAVPTTGGKSTLLTDFDNESYFLPDVELPTLGTFLYHSPLDGDTDLYAVPLTGGEHLNLTRNDGWGDSLEGISGDERFILFSNLSDEPVYDDEGNLSPESDTDIYLSRTDGTGDIIQLTHNYVYDRVEAVIMVDTSGPSTERRRTMPAAAQRIIDDSVRIYSDR